MADTIKFKNNGGATVEVANNPANIAAAKAAGWTTGAKAPKKVVSKDA